MPGRLSSQRRFVVLSTCSEPWGGSEELWWGAACVLREHGHGVRVLKTCLAPAHPRIRRLRELSCRVDELDRDGSRRSWVAASLDDAGALHVGRRPSPDRRCGPGAGGSPAGPRRRLAGAELRRRSARAAMPTPAAPVRCDLTEGHRAELGRLTGCAPTTRPGCAAARLAVFVSEHNRRLTEEQIGERLPNAARHGKPRLGGRSGSVAVAGRRRGRAEARLRGETGYPRKGTGPAAPGAGDGSLAQPSATCVVLRPGPHRDTLTRLAAGLGVQRASFDGHIEDIEAMWRSHHALVLPSRAEGLPLSVLEAMSCGRPAIVTDVGGNAELIEEGRTGFVAVSASVTALDDALQRAWARREAWPALGLAAASRVHELIPDDPARALADRLLVLAGAAAA